MAEGGQKRYQNSTPRAGLDDTEDCYLEQYMNVACILYSPLKEYRYNLYCNLVYVYSKQRVTLEIVGEFYLMRIPSLADHKALNNVCKVSVEILHQPFYV
jgi:hypothetical protein